MTIFEQKTGRQPFWWIVPIVKVVAHISVAALAAFIVANIVAAAFFFVPCKEMGCPAMYLAAGVLGMIAASGTFVGLLIFFYISGRRSQMTSPGFVAQSSQNLLPLTIVAPASFMFIFEYFLVIGVFPLYTNDLQIPFLFGPMTLASMLVGYFSYLLFVNSIRRHWYRNSGLLYPHIFSFGIALPLLWGLIACLIGYIIIMI